MSQEQILGSVVVALGTIVGLFLTVGKPILSLNTSITKLTATVETIQKEFDSFKQDSHKELVDLSEKNSETHQRIFDKLDNHENRISKLEK